MLYTTSTFVSQCSPVLPLPRCPPSPAPLLLAGVSHVALRCCSHSCCSIGTILAERFGMLQQKRAVDSGTAREELYVRGHVSWSTVYCTLI